MPVNSAYRRYLKFIWDGQLFHFVCVPFGLSSAPKLFTMLLRPIFASFGQQSIRCSYYIDDSLNMDKNRDVCVRNSRTIVKTLE